MRDTSIYCILLEDDTRYVGITNNLERRLNEHEEDKGNIMLLRSMEVGDRKLAEGLEATLHQIQKANMEVDNYFCTEFVNLHSLWFNSSCKGRYTPIKPLLKF